MHSLTLTCAHLLRSTYIPYAALWVYLLAEGNLLIALIVHHMQMESSCGDFAEWHEKIDPRQHLDEGDIVGFQDGKVGLVTENCHILGVVSARPAVLGSRPKQDRSVDDHVVVAYCGRVPVRVHGPVRCGDVLVPSGKSDGVAIVSQDSPKDVAVHCAVESAIALAGNQAAIGAVAVAMESCPDTGIVLVHSVVTPPGMTKEVMRHL